MEILVICTPYHILFGDQIKAVEMMRWTELVARVREKGSGYKVLVLKPEPKVRLGVIRGVKMKVILKWILK
jgi:hypothetical protein